MDVSKSLSEASKRKTLSAVTNSFSLIDKQLPVDLLKVDKLALLPNIQGANGSFKTNTAEIRIKASDNIQQMAHTLAHEYGHYVYETIGKECSSDITTQLDNLCVELADVFLSRDDEFISSRATSSHSKHGSSLNYAIRPTELFARGFAACVMRESESVAESNKFKSGLDFTVRETIGFQGSMNSLCKEFTKHLLNKELSTNPDYSLDESRFDSNIKELPGQDILNILRNEIQINESLDRDLLLEHLAGDDKSIRQMNGNISVARNFVDNIQEMTTENDFYAMVGASLKDREQSPLGFETVNGYKTMSLRCESDLRKNIGANIKSNQRKISIIDHIESENTLALTTKLTPHQSSELKQHRESLSNEIDNSNQELYNASSASLASFGERRAFEKASDSHIDCYSKFLSDKLGLLERTSSGASAVLAKNKLASLEANHLKKIGVECCNSNTFVSNDKKYSLYMRNKALGGDIHKKSNLLMSHKVADFDSNLTDKVVSMASRRIEWICEGYDGLSSDTRKKLRGSVYNNSSYIKSLKDENLTLSCDKEKNTIEPKTLSADEQINDIMKQIQVNIENNIISPEETSSLHPEANSMLNKLIKDAEASAKNEASYDSIVSDYDNDIEI